jgi:Flp pilus assembly protein TadD
VQAGYWQNSERLFGHTLEVTSRNFVARDQLGEAFATEGKTAEARAQFVQALDITPAYAPALSHMSQLLLGEGDFQGAATLLQRLLDRHPDDSLTHSDLAMALAHLGKADEAIPHYREAIRLEPARPEPMNNLAWLLATSPRREVRDGGQAVSLAERSCEIAGRTNLWFLSTLAAAYAEAGQFTNAVSTQERVCQLAAAQRSTTLLSASVTSPQQAVSSAQLESFRQRRELYRGGSPYRAP